MASQDSPADEMIFIEVRDSEGREVLPGLWYDPEDAIDRLKQIIPYLRKKTNGIQN